MKILAVLLVTATAAVAVAVQPASARSDGRSEAGPSLSVVAAQPFVVRGVAFRPSERVWVTALTLIGPRKTVVRASGAGAFRATLRLVGRPCGRAFAVRAVGELGSRALLQLRSAPCVPPSIR
jgi:hypothetical protein